MPKYDYRCSACDNQFEAYHSMSAHRPACPNCGSDVEPLFLHAPAVHGYMARGREQAMRSLEPSVDKPNHGPQCPCCH